MYRRLRIITVPLLPGLACLATGRLDMVPSAFGPRVSLRWLLGGIARRLLAPVILLLLAGMAPGEPLVVGSEEDYPPFAIGYSDETAGGFTVDLWKAVAAERGLNHTIRVRPFRQILDEFKAGKIDVMINLAQSDERRAFADFSVPHVIVHGAIFVRKGGSGIQSEADLAGKSIIVLNADLAHDYAISKGWEKQLVTVDNAADGLKLLAAGRHDAMLLSKLAGMQTLAKLKIGNVRPLDAHAGFSQKFSFAVKKGDSELLAKINEGLSIAKSAGTYDALYEKWFGVFAVREISLRQLLKYLVPVATGLLIVAGFFMVRRHERRKSEIRLRESDARYRAVVETSSDAIFLMDLTGRIRAANPAAARMHGFTVEELLTMRIQDLDSPASAKEAAGRIERMRNGEVLTFEVDHVRKDGTTFPVEVLASAVEIGDEWFLVGFDRDITGRKAAEDALRQSEEHLRTIVKLEPECVKVVSADGKLIEMNPAGLAMIEADSLKQVRGLSVADLVAPEHRERFAMLHHRALNGETVRGEFSIKGIRGTRRWMETHEVPYRDARGAIIGVLGITRDITVRKEAVEELERSLATLQLFIDTVPAYIAFVDVEERYRLVNRRYEEHFGRPRDQIVGLRLRDLQSRDGYAEMMPHVRVALAGRSVRYQSHPAGPDGASHWFDVQYVPRRAEDGTVIGFFVLVFDITDAKQAEEATRLLQERFSLAARGAHLGVWDWDVVHDETFMNSEYHEMLGYEPGEVRGNLDFFKSHVHPDDLPGVIATMDENLQGRSEESVTEYRLKNKAGEYRWVRGAGKVVERDQQGSPLRMAGVIMDITDRRAMEDSLRGSEARYRQLFDANPHPMWAYDLESLRFLAVNNAAIAHYGYSRDEFLAMTIKDIRPPEDVPALLAKVGAVTEGFDLAGIWHHRKRDGTIIDVEISSHVIEFAGRRAEVVLAHDVTERRRAEARILKAEDAERRRIAQELHDSTAQDLVAVTMNLGVLHESLGPGDPKAARIIEDSVALVENSVNSLRTLSYVLHPPRLDEAGLAGALAEYVNGLAARTEMRIQAEIAPEFGRLHEDMEIVLFRVVQEGISNVLRHSMSVTATIRLARKESSAVLEVEDYGRGMAGAGAPGVGIAGMRERLQRLGGRLEIESDSSGTIVRAVLPLRENHK